MAISARSRRGTSPSFWRNHNAMQLMMAQACMPSVRTPMPIAKVTRVAPADPVWVPTPMQRLRYQARSNSAPLLPIAG
jgi:hypothetical protein